MIIAKTRDTGTGAARACRRRGLVPCIVYGKGIDSLPISLEASELRKLVAKGMGHIYKLKVQDADFDDNIMLQAVDRNPLTGEIIHLDLHRISLEDEIRLEVPVMVLGEEEITGDELVLQRQIREVTVECLPKDIPSQFTVDVSEMEIGETFLVGDLPVPEGVKIITDPEEVVAVLLVSRMEIEEEEVEELEEEVAAEEAEEVATDDEEPEPEN